MANAGPASPLLDGVSAILRSVSCGRVCTVSMRSGKGVENCVNTQDIVAGMAGGAQLDVTGSMRNGFRKLCATLGTGGASQIGSCRHSDVMTLLLWGNSLARRTYQSPATTTCHSPIASAAPKDGSFMPSRGD
jgi:hypothetical protein